MTDETRKALTIYIGECWHEAGNRSWIGLFGQPTLHECKHCQHRGCVNRTFTTTDDLFAVFGKMVEKGDWGEFWEHAKMEFYRSPNWNGCGFADTTWVIAWLFCLSAPDQIGERMEMVRKWLKEANNGIR